MVTGVENIYSVAQFSRQLHPIHHLYSHLVCIAICGLFGAGMGCFLLWMLRTLLPGNLNK
ncbi:MAG: hypothetical protein ACE5JX_11995 [Acidobacteriota bacterium]